MHIYCCGPANKDTGSPGHSPLTQAAACDGGDSRPATHRGCVQGPHVPPAPEGGGGVREDLLTGGCLSSLSPLISTLLKCNPASLLHQDWKAAIESLSAMSGALCHRDTPKGMGPGVVHTCTQAHAKQNKHVCFCAHIQSKTHVRMIYYIPQHTDVIYWIKQENLLIQIMTVMLFSLTAN